MLLRTRKLFDARADANAFVEHCFTDPSGVALYQAAVHRGLQAFLSDNRRGLVELPRDHGKSTQVCARVVWELGRDPSLRVMIVCASEALAAARGRFVREAIESNPMVRAVFPHLTPAGPWSDTRLTVVRPASVIGPSLTAIGVGGASTGSRADLLICDDIVDVKAIASRAERERVKDRFKENLINLLEPNGRFWGLCTPWHQDDLNVELKRTGTYPVFSKPIGPDLEPVWPEKWPRAALEARRAEIGTVPFSRGYRLVPVADGATAVRLEWVQFWDDSGPLAPRAGSDSRSESATADIVALAVDPAIATHARADRTGLVVLAKCGPEIRVLEAVARRVSTPDLVPLIGALDARWQPDTILFESNAAFRGIAELMTRQAGFGPKVKEVAQTKDKASRAAVFSVPVENGTFRLKGHGGAVDPAQQELLDEMTTFPFGEHDDLLDAAMIGTAYLVGVREPRVR
jgi:phage terminase large subunit-like protein